KLEGGGQWVGEGGGVGGAQVHQRGALEAGEDRRVELLRQLLVVSESEARARPAQRLVRGRGDDMGVGKRTGMRATGDEAGKMRHIDKELGADLIGNFAEAAEVDETRIGPSAGDADLR